MKQAIRKHTQNGFTLVEVIVVAIIVAALAAVAIPMYNGYVTTSRNNAAANTAGAVASFMGSCLNQAGTASVVDNAMADVAAGVAITMGATVSCAGTGLATAPTITVPQGVSVTITMYAASPGSVTANAGADNQTYNY